METQAVSSMLMREAFRYSDNVTSEKDVIEIALSEYILRRKKKSIKELKGKIHFCDDYDYKAMR
ncbi:MAG: type II toxin-antitoxin system VapB family antitoxin [Prevotellaceae bacterium]|jgi:hypothetical protein|nr:type II toxin-antitoxin system VapB family antitoxin [Prevotellaceae bacterium]